MEKMEKERSAQYVRYTGTRGGIYMAGQFWGSIYIMSNTNFIMRKRKAKEKKREKEEEEEGKKWHGTLQVHNM